MGVVIVNEPHPLIKVVLAINNIRLSSQAWLVIANTSTMEQSEQDERNNENDRLKMKINENYQKQRNSFWKLKCLQCIPTRYTIVLVTFLGFVNVYTLRVNLSMAIVAMVNNSITNSPGNSSSHLVSKKIKTHSHWSL